MFKILSAFLVALLLTPAIYAKDAQLFGCTKSKHVTSLTIVLVDNASIEALTRITNAFKAASASLSDEEFVGPPGWKAFMERLSEDDIHTIVTIFGPPTVDSDSKCVIKG